MLIKPELSYPGVYVAEVPSVPGGIPDIPTGIAAFVGRARMGPTDAPVLLGSFGDFESRFGGLWALSPLSYAVKQFFDNGGSQACVVRICGTPAEVVALGEAVGYAPDTGPGGEPRKPPVPYAETLGLTPITPDETGRPGGADDGRARINISGTAAGQKPGLEVPADGFQLLASNPGDWGNGLRVEVDRKDIDDGIEDACGVARGSMVNLTVHSDGARERHENVSFDKDAGPQRIDRQLAASAYVRHPSDSAPIDKAHRLTADEGAALAAIVALHQQTYRGEAIATEKQYLAQLPAGSEGDDGYYLGDTAFFTAGEAGQKGIFQLEKIDIFNLLVIPRDRFADEGPEPEIDFPTVWNYVDKRRAFWILEAPKGDLDAWDGAIIGGQPGVDRLINESFGNPGDLGRNGAVFYPDVMFPDPLLGMRPKRFGPAGAVAGIFARTDAARGVWKAPAGTEATVAGVVGLTARLNDETNGVANLQGINCLRDFATFGTVIWGSRTLRGAQALNDAFKYVPVRRLSLYVYESIHRGLQWAVFQPNDESLWATICDRVDGFMTNLMRQGAFQGETAKDAFFVRCGLGQTMTDEAINDGMCIVEVGFAAVRPAEFVVLYFEQMTAASQS